MSKMAWLDKAVDDLLFYMAPVLGSVLIIAGFVSLLIFTADESGLTGTVSNPKNDVLVSIKADMIERKEA